MSLAKYGLKDCTQYSKCSQTYILYKNINISVESILKDLLINPRTCVALTAAFWQCRDGLRSLVHHTPRSTFTSSRSVDTFVVPSYLMYDAGRELPICITLHLAALNLSNQTLEHCINLLIIFSCGPRDR